MMEEVTEPDLDVCFSIVATLRLYIYMCKLTGKLPRMENMVEIAYAEDAATKAMIAARKIGPDDEEDQS